MNSRWSLHYCLSPLFLFLSANTDSGASVSLFATLTTPVIDSSSFSSDLSSTPSTALSTPSMVDGKRYCANASCQLLPTTKQWQQQQQKQQQKYNVIQASRKDLFNFSLPVRQGHVARQSVRHCGLYRFSGAWPYVKLFSMFILWEISGKTVKASTRGKWLKFVDRLGKWSLFDSFVMTMSMVGFRFHLRDGDDDYDDIITQKYRHHHSVI